MAYGQKASSCDPLTMVNQPPWSIMVDHGLNNHGFHHDYKHGQPCLLLLPNMVNHAYSMKLNMVNHSQFWLHSANRSQLDCLTIVEKHVFHHG